VRRADVAAVIVLAVLSTTGCVRSGNAGTGVGGVEASTVSATASSTRQQPSSACRSMSLTGEVTTVVDWVDFVQLDGIQYYAGFDGKAAAVAEERLGSAVGRVECQLSVLKFRGQPGPAVDGDAAYLSVGTDVRAIRGYAPSCRVAARIDGANRVYLAHADVDGVSRPVPCAKAP